MWKYQYEMWKIWKKENINENENEIWKEIMKSNGNEETNMRKWNSEIISMKRKVIEMAMKSMANDVNNMNM